jgi:hypothetical protein
MTIPGCEFGDNETHDQKANRRLYVRPMTDGKPLVRHGQEEVEPQR